MATNDWLAEILETYYMQLKQLWVANIRREETYHAHKVKRKQETITAIEQKHQQDLIEAKQKLIEKYQSFCGCPMCTFHSEPYQAQAHKEKTS